jgi:hypothetical protein
MVWFFSVNLFDKEETVLFVHSLGVKVDADVSRQSRSHLICRADSSFPVANGQIPAFQASAAVPV